MYAVSCLSPGPSPRRPQVFATRFLLFLVWWIRCASVDPSLLPSIKHTTASLKIAVVATYRAALPLCAHLSPPPLHTNTHTQARPPCACLAASGTNPPSSSLWPGLLFCRAVAETMQPPLQDCGQPVIWRRCLPPVKRRPYPCLARVFPRRTGGGQAPLGGGGTAEHTAGRARAGVPRSCGSGGKRWRVVVCAAKLLPLHGSLGLALRPVSSRDRILTTTSYKRQPCRPPSAC